MDPATIAAIVAAGGSLVGLVAKMIQTPDQAAVLQEMRDDLAKLQAAIGPGGTLEQMIAANDKALDDAIAAEKEQAPNPVKPAEEITKP